MALRTTSCRNDSLPDSDTLIFSSTERRKRSSGGPRLAGDRIRDLALIERGLDFVEVLVEQLLRFAPRTRRTAHGARLP